jgi:ubiquinone biosynthesis protein UbiJ
MLTSTLENVLNRGLPRSPRAQQLCAELAGRRVAIAIASAQSGRSPYVLVESMGGSLKLTAVTAGGLPSAPSDAAPPDATITGGPLSLLALSGPAPEAVLQRGDVRIDGDAELAQKFRELALLLRPDLEEELSLVLGDVPAHQLGRLCVTSPSTWATSGGISSHAAKLTNFYRALTHCVKTLTVSRRASTF